MHTDKLLTATKAARKSGELGTDTRVEFGPTTRIYVHDVWWDVAVHLTDDTASLYLRADFIFGGYRWAIRADNTWVHVGNSHDPDLAVKDGMARLRSNH